MRTVPRPVSRTRMAARLPPPTVPETVPIRPSSRRRDPTTLQRSLASPTQRRARRPPPRGPIRTNPDDSDARARRTSATGVVVGMVVGLSAGWAGGTNTGGAGFRCRRDGGLQSVVIRIGAAHPEHHLAVGRVASRRQGPHVSHRRVRCERAAGPSGPAVGGLPGLHPPSLSHLTGEVNVRRVVMVEGGAARGEGRTPARAHRPAGPGGIGRPAGSHVLRVGGGPVVEGRAAVFGVEGHDPPIGSHEQGRARMVILLQGCVQNEARNCFVA